MIEMSSSVTSNGKARISVAMGTYNGGRYLPDQLASIAAQTRLPDEMVVCDDGSTDATIVLLQEFARTARFPVKVIQNERNLGSTRNFVKICELCEGDLIALSDQDDIWHRDRLERSEQMFDAHPEVGLVFSDADLIDEAGSPLHGSLWHFCGFTAATEQSLLAGDYTLPVRMRFVTGATVMFRTWLRTCFPVEPGWIHDEWLAAAAPLFADLLPIREPLIQYRQHASQQVGPTTRHGPLQRFTQRVGILLNADLAQSTHWLPLERAARLTRAVCDRFPSETLTEAGSARRERYAEYAHFQQNRAFLPCSRLQRMFPVLKQRQAYSRYYLHGGFGSMLRDLLSTRHRRPATLPTQSDADQR